MRLQTFYLISVQSEKEVDYSTFKEKYMHFEWDSPVVREIPVIDWDERERINRERELKTIKQVVVE